MTNIKKFFSQKFLWIGLFSLIGVVCVFLIGILGSSVNPKPSEIPIGLVIDDEAYEGESKTIHFGKSIKHSLTNNSEIPFEWTVLEDKNTAINQMNNKSYYATIIIPEHTSKKISSLIHTNSHQPEIEIIINEGLNYTGANAVNQIIDEIVFDMNSQIRNMIFDQLTAQEMSLPSEGIQKLVNSLQVKKQIINEVGSNSSNGNLPVMLTQILWLSVFICSLIIFLNKKRIAHNQWNWISLLNQLIAGFISLLIIVSTIVLFANYVLDSSIPNMWHTFFFLLFSGFVFFLLQNALINWIGLISSPFILLLFLFSIPVLSMPPEYLPNVTTVLLYSWIPLKFSVEGLKEIFYFGNKITWEYIYILSSIGIGSFIIMLINIFMKQKRIIN